MLCFYAAALICIHRLSIKFLLQDILNANCLICVWLGYAECLQAARSIEKLLLLCPTLKGCGAVSSSPLRPWSGGFNCQLDVGVQHGSGMCRDSWIFDAFTDAHIHMKGGGVILGPRLRIELWRRSGWHHVTRGAQMKMGFETSR